MCILCNNTYKIKSENLDISNCQIIAKLPKTLINVEILNISNTKITKIPKELTKLSILYCHNTQITSIPKELINLEIIYCYNTLIIQIPSTLIELEMTISNSLVKKTWFKTKHNNEIKKIIILEKNNIINLD